MVDVEQRALRALEQNAFSLAPPRIEQRPHHIHERQHFGGQRRKIVVNILAVDRLEVETAAQRVVMRKQTFDLGPSAGKSARSMNRIARRPTLSS